MNFKKSIVGMLIGSLRHVRHCTITHKPKVIAPNRCSCTLLPRVDFLHFFCHFTQNTQPQSKNEHVLMILTKKILLSVYPESKMLKAINNKKKIISGIKETYTTVSKMNCLQRNLN